MFNFRHPYPLVSMLFCFAKSIMYIGNRNTEKALKGSEYLIICRQIVLRRLRSSEHTILPSKKTAQTPVYIAFFPLAKISTVKS